MREAFGTSAVFVDGSATRDGPVPLHHATWAVVALTQAGEVSAVISGSVGTQLPKTAAASEHVAALAAAVRTDASDILSDTQNMTGIERWPRAQLCDLGNFYSGVRVLIRGHPRWRPDRRIVKVKAHLDMSSLSVDSSEWWAAQGNTQVDPRAKAAAAANLRLPPRDLIDRHVSVGSMLKRFLTFVSEALLCFPSPHFGRRKRSLVQCKRPDKDLLVGSRVFREALGPWAGTVRAATTSSPRTSAVGTSVEWDGQIEPSAPSAPPLFLPLRLPLGPLLSRPLHSPVLLPRRLSWSLTRRKATAGSGERPAEGTSVVSALT